MHTGATMLPSVARTSHITIRFGGSCGSIMNKVIAEALSTKFQACDAVAQPDARSDTVLNRVTLRIRLLVKKGTAICSFRIAAPVSPSSR